MRHPFRFSLALAAVVAGSLILPVGIAGATGPRSAVGVTVMPLTSVPNSNIQKSGKKAVFNPTALSASWSSATAIPCTSTAVAATITNTTSRKQKVVLNGAIVARIPRGSLAGLCFYGSGPATFVYGLKKSTSTLTVSVS
jgi:hypothetical protein